MPHPIPPSYSEPTVMWRMRRTHDSTAHALIDTHDGKARVIWFVNGRTMGERSFDDWTAAIHWSDRLRAHCWTVGWRLSDDIIEGPPARREP